ncbi:hypothetical protein FA048_10770 [Pedobacter polaris]|uniref:YceI family protein n=1 Tax=Pedobacter polaris TaxID=2571273 RepID=A0A4U1CRG3_9SPHI|nr:hypothetical protein [Pedobacter polaris]TKC10651.1 hypothetical protein FA048_10770 [Pedobacter polaris]
MKKLIKLAISKILISLLATCTCLFLFSSTKLFAQEEAYQIQSSKLSIEGSGKLKDWKPEIENFGCTGKFSAHEKGLDSISNFSFSLSVNEADHKQDKVGSDIYQAMLSSGNNKIAFSQKNLMILPILKVAQLNGEVQMLNGLHYAPMSLQYVMEKDQSITVKGTQVIWLYELGVVPKDIKDYHAKDKISINIEFTLTKISAVIAKSQDAPMEKEIRFSN